MYAIQFNYCDYDANDAFEPWTSSLWLGGWVTEEAAQLVVDQMNRELRTVDPDANYPRDVVPGVVRAEAFDADAAMADALQWIERNHRPSNTETPPSMEVTEAYERRGRRMAARAPRGGPR
jgi:hypothetical protein